MFCRKCYAKLEPEVDQERCWNCGRRFDPSRRRTYLRRPFPGVPHIIGRLIGTTLVGIAAAYVVAGFQAARTSGH